MAGANQHYIPQFLQRGFASRRERKVHYVWEYHRLRTPENLRTKKIGAEENFYTESDDREVDDTITKAENRYANLVNKLRAASLGAVVQPEVLDLIAHLEVRTRHIRESFLANGEYLTRMMMKRLSDPDILSILVRRYLESEAPEMKCLLPFINLRDPQISSMLANFQAMMLQRLSAAAKSGHISALKKSIQPAARMASLGGLRFRIAATEGANIVLGDSGSLFAIGDPPTYRPYSQKDDRICAVFLPLSPTRMLIGEEQQRIWDFTSLKRQIVRCSFEFFVAHECSDENALLQLEIGTEASILTEPEIDNIVDDCLRDSE